MVASSYVRRLAERDFAVQHDMERYHDWLYAMSKYDNVFIMLLDNLKEVFDDMWRDQSDPK